MNFRTEKRTDLLVVAVSICHGTFVDRRIQLQVIGDKDVLTSCKVYALHGPRISSELAMLENIRTLHPKNMPILHLLINFVEISSHHNSLGFEINELVDGAIVKYNFNEDQARVLYIVASWFSQNGNDSTNIHLSNPEFCLVHGPFGSGKSYLLVILVIFLAQLLERRNDSSTKILVSAATNVAVDRILTGLLKHGFTNFLRVGSLKMIAKNILPYSLKVSSKADDDELGPKISTSQKVKRASGIKNLKAAKDEKLKEQKERLNMVRVVGVTCFSATKAVLEGSNFKVCLLDECSQIPEPLSLLPLCRFGCEKLVAVGDPAQLPPLLSGGCGLNAIKDYKNHNNATWRNCLYNDSKCETEKNFEGSSENLTRPLFVRLVAMGHKPVLLRTQYRCHPRLATISNELFYNGQLRSGCSEIQRLPLVKEIPVVLFCDTYDLGKEVRDHFNSYSNLYEAKLACQLVTHFLKRGVSGSQIGVIVLYKSQACLLQKLLENEKEDWQSAGRRNYKALTMKKNKDLAIFNVRTSPIKEVQVSTVDAFQGMEKDIIILSCCRTNGLGFLSSPNRVNVALTRARHHLIIIGKAENLQKSWFWQELLRHVHSIPGAYRSASSLNTDLQRAMEGNENTASHNCEENHVQIQDLNNNPKNSNGLTHVLMPTFSSKCWHGEQNSLIGEKPKKCQKNADITSSYDSLQQVPFHESHMESEDTSTAEASELQSFDSEAQDTNELILPSCHHNSSWVSEVIRNPGSCYYENCHSQVSSKQNRPEREKSEKEMALQSEVTLQEIPDLPGELHMCSIEMEETLNELSFRAKDFWYGYKLYCIGHYSHSAEHKHQFQECKMGHALSKLYGEDKIWWKASFDEIVRLAWSMMEDYVKRKFGEDCKDIWTLIKTYDNLEELAANEYGSFFLQMTEVESSRIEVSQMMVDRSTDGDCNTVFNELRQQLGKMDNRLQHLEGKGCKQVHSSVDYSIASVQINDKIATSPSAVEDVENELSALAFSGRKDCGQGFSSLLGQVLDGVSDNAPQTQRSNHISKVKCFDTFQEHYISASDTKPQESDLPATPGWLPNFDLGI